MENKKKKIIAAFDKLKNKEKLIAAFDRLDKETKAKRFAEKIEADNRSERRGILGWIRRRRFNTKGVETSRTKKPGLFGRLREPGRFFSPERIEERHDFRIKVSSNRKWMLIGLAVVAVCGTIIYLSVTYGGGGFSFVTKILGVFK